MTTRAKVKVKQPFVHDKVGSWGQYFQTSSFFKKEARSVIEEAIFYPLLSKNGSSSFFEEPSSVIFEEVKYDLHDDSDS